ncbi:MAG TPA: TonB-dependent receptor [Verrucomicrobiae bacterium]|nr:TonB-dependent receptor [Verrucomicrobiae bacterium]
MGHGQDNGTGWRERNGRHSCCRIARALLLLTGAAASLIPACSRAADEDLLFAEIPTVYAATRHAEPVSQVPAAVTIITRDDIRKYGYRTLAQALESVPGFFLSDDHGYQYLGVRGLSLPTDYNARILFLLNGLPLDDMYFGGLSVELTPDMLDAIDRIEVVKGPASALYGSNALFATVNIITRKGADVHGAIVTGEVGSDPSGRGVFTYGGTLTNGLDVFLSGHYENGRGERSLSFGQFGTAHNADGQWLADGFLSAQYQDFFAQVWYADRVKEIPTGQFGTIIGDDDTTTEDRWYVGELRWQHALSDDKTVMVRVYGDDYLYHGNYAYADPQAAMDSETSDDRWVGNEAQFNWRFLEHHELTLGALYEHHWTHLNGDYTDSAGNVTFRYPGTDLDFSYWAAYAQDEIQLVPRLKLTVGGRFDAYSDYHMQRATPQVSLVWSATEDTLVKLLYGRAFRAPSVYEQTYAAGSGSGITNPELAPETITTYEVVLEQDFHHGLKARVSGFRNDSAHLIIPTIDNENDTVFRNLADVRTWGVEAEVTEKLANGMRGFVNGTWQQSHEESGALINSPEWIGNFGAVAPLVGDKLSLGVRENYVSRRGTLEPGVETRAAPRTDLTLSSEDALPHWSFLLSIQNLFNEHNETPGGPDATLNVIPERGRTIYFRASYKF